MATPARSRPGTIQRIVAVILVAELVLAGVLVFKAWPRDDPVMVPPEDPEVLVFSDGDPADLERLSGTVTLILENPPPGGAELWIRADNGEGRRLAAAAMETPWDTTLEPNGPYRIVAVAGDEEIAATQVRLQNARAEATTTAAVVGTTTAVAAGGSAVASTLTSRAAMAAAQIGQESLIAVGEDHLALRTAARRRHMASWLAFAITLVLVFLFFPFEGLPTLLPSEYWAAIPVAGGVSVVFVAAALGSEYLLGIMGRATTKFRFLTSGAISLVLSSILFRTPFGYPGYVEEVDDEDHDGTDDEPPHVEGIRAIASLTFLLTLLVPFLWVGYRWNYAIVDQAMEIALVGIATSAMPIKPLPGYDIWVWRRSAALLYCIGAYVLYFGFMLAFLPNALLVPLGVLGLLLYGGTLAWLRGRSAEPQPAWYTESLDLAHGFRDALVSLAPNTIAATGRLMHRVAATSAHAIDRAVAAASRAVAAAVVPITAIGARIQARRIARAAAAMEEAYWNAMAADLLEQLDGLDDDATFTLIGPDGEPRSHHVGALRDTTYRNELLRDWQGRPPSMVTVIDGDQARTVRLRGR